MGLEVARSRRPEPLGERAGAGVGSMRCARLSLSPHPTPQVAADTSNLKINKIKHAMKELVDP